MKDHKNKINMKKYLSFGGGVNSVAMMLMLLDQKDDFEAIFVDHGADYPETYEYFEMFQNWLKGHGHKEITVLKASVTRIRSGVTYNSLYEYCEKKEVIPSVRQRWCTKEWKVFPINNYVETPCFMYIGIDLGESHRATISIEDGIEKRYPLIEQGITRQGCKEIILKHGLPVPIKSGCFFCPYQSIAGWERLRMDHPELFCKAEKLEIGLNEKRKKLGQNPFYLSSKKAPLRSIVSEDQQRLFKEDEFPPCQCGL